MKSSPIDYNCLSLKKYNTCTLCRRKEDAFIHLDSFWVKDLHLRTNDTEPRSDPTFCTGLS